MFGLQWLRKAILRASGNKALHDEVVAYRDTVAEAQTAAVQRRGLVADWYAFTLSFKGVVLEGLEVAFIALTFGANQGDVPLAAAAAVAAVLVVAVAGIAVRAPLSRVPENSMKFVVGVMLTAFGIFWALRGQVRTGPATTPRCWSSIPTVGLYALALVALFGVDAPSTSPTPKSLGNRGDRQVIAKLRAFAAFWYDFIVGDDWRVALGVDGRFRQPPMSMSHSRSAPMRRIVVVAVVVLLPMSIYRVTRRAR